MSIDNFQDYLDLYKNSEFRGAVETAFINIQSAYPTNENDNRVISNMIGINLDYEDTNKTKPVFSSPPSSGIFYIFWNDDTNVEIARDLIKTYILSNNSLNSSTGLSSFRNANIFITYILSFFFSTIQYDVAGNPISFPPDILNPINITPSILNIKNFLQSNTLSSVNNILGCGNYSIPANLGSLGNYIPIANRGFIYYLCQEQYTRFQETNNNLTGEKSINSYRHLTSQNELLLSFCGCFTPTPPFFHENIPGFSQKIGDSPCDPLCYNNVTFKLYDNKFNTDGTIEGGGDQLGCNSQICVIDNFSINSLNSNGKVNFNQTCKGCLDKNSGCLCFIDVSNDEIFEKITSGGDGLVTQARYTQNCPGNSVCFAYNDGEIKEVECNKFNTARTGGVFSVFSDGLTKITSPDEIPQFFWFFVAIIFILLILFMFGVASYG